MQVSTQLKIIGRVGKIRSTDSAGSAFIASMQSPDIIVFKGSACAPFVIVFINTASAPAHCVLLVENKMPRQRICGQFLF